MKLIETEKFVKKANKILGKNKLLEKKFEHVLNKLVKDPFNPSLNTHKLKGKLSEIFSARLTSDLRILFKFVKDNNELCILLITIGKHDELF